jgi:asparagine synthase (glutamine-hydrolysing)
MVHTLEAREPFLDIDLVQYAFSIPVNSKIRPWESSLQKLCLRKTYEDLLPEYIISRPKVPFDKGSAIDAVLHKHINKEFSDKAFEAEKNKYTYLRSRDKETMFYFLIWKKFFLPASQTFVLDRGRYVNYDEIPPENIINF